MEVKRPIAVPARWIGYSPIPNDTRLLLLFMYGDIAAVIHVLPASVIPYRECTGTTSQGGEAARSIYIHVIWIADNPVHDDKGVT